MSIRLEMLGTARVAVSDGFHPLKATVRDQTLSYLALADDWVTRDRLGFLFWADSPDSTVRHNVRQLLKRIRRLEWVDGLETTSEAVKWSVPNDVADLRTVLARRTWDVLPACGELLPGLERRATVEFEDWLLDQRLRVLAMWRDAVVAAARHAGTEGDLDKGLSLLEPLLADDDVSDVLPLYMELAVKAGRRGLAVQSFERVERRLRDELGVDTPAMARDMARRLVAKGDELQDEPERVNLVGRAAERSDITSLLTRPECRLLTLLGPGGIGKSTLARSVLRHLHSRFVDGGSVVSLEAVEDPNDVVAAIASNLSINLDPRADPVDQLIAEVRLRNMLLVLDNAEHLRLAWVRFSQLLESCPGLTLLVTSRERLRLENEWVYEVHGLTEDDGVQLFLERGRRVTPEVTVSATEALAICRAVGGSPLGLELAAPWLRVMSAGEIVSEIQRDQELLSGGHRDGLSRHQSMAATMKHSWDLASAEQRRVVEALSVFATPYDRRLTEQVADVGPAVLRDLLDMSLLHRRPDGRYSSHPLVRHYAAARLAEDPRRHDEVRGRHAAAMLSLVHSPTGAPTKEAFLEDIVMAWHHAVASGAIGMIKPAIEGITALMVATGRIDRGLRLLDDASALIERTTPDDPAPIVTIRLAESRLLYLRGDHSGAALTAEKALDAATAADDQRVRVKASLALGWARKWLAGDKAQYETIRPALPLAESLGDDGLLAEVLNGLGCSAPTLEQCRDHLQRGLVPAELTPGLRALLLHNLGMVRWGLGEGEAAIDNLSTALGIATSTGDQNRMVESLSSLAFLHAELGDPTTAQRLAADAESRTGSSEILETRIYVRLVAGEVRRLSGDPEGAEIRAKDALEMAANLGNEPFTLRALRLHGQLLLDRAELDRGLGILAFVLPRTAIKGGDFTSEIINPRAWEEATRNRGRRQIDRARAWAGSRELDDVIAAAIPARSQ